MDKQQSYELKYQLPLNKAAQVLSWMQATMLPDGAYPAAYIHTLYYDTSELAALEEKINSDYLKTKVRLRWYRALDGSFQGQQVFTEVKFRIGRLRRKLRFNCALSADTIATADLSDPLLLTINNQLHEQGVDAKGPYFPALQLVYLRHRFIEPISGARVCLDQDIAVTRANPRFFPHARSCKIPAAVFEYKSPAADLPSHLFRLFELGARRLSFSKYFACVEALYEHGHREARLPAAALD